MIQNRSMSDELLEEYKSVREDIFRSQQARLYIVGFAYAAVGAGLVPAVRDFTSSRELSVLAFLAFAEVLVLAAVLTTIYYTRDIDQKGAYIRRFIEPRTADLRWETRWLRYRQNRRSLLPSRLALGQSKTFSFLYMVLTVGLLLSGAAAQAYSTLDAWAAVLVIVGIADLAFCADLYLRWTPTWNRIEWTSEDDVPPGVGGHPST